MADIVEDPRVMLLDVAIAFEHVGLRVATSKCEWLFACENSEFDGVIVNRMAIMQQARVEFAGGKRFCGWCHHC